MAGTSGTPFSSAGGGIIPGQTSRAYWDKVGKDLRAQVAARQKGGRPLTKAEKQLAKAMKLRNTPRKLK